MYYLKALKGHCTISLQICLLMLCILTAPRGTHILLFPSSTDLLSRLFYIRVSTRAVRMSQQCRSNVQGWVSWQIWKQYFSLCMGTCPMPLCVNGYDLFQREEKRRTPRQAQNQWCMGNNSVWSISTDKQRICCWWCYVPSDNKTIL